MRKCWNVRINDVTNYILNWINYQNYYQNNGQKTEILRTILTKTDRKKTQVNTWNDVVIGKNNSISLSTELKMEI